MAMLLSLIVIYDDTQQRCFMALRFHVYCCMCCHFIAMATAYKDPQHVPMCDHRQPSRYLFCVETPGPSYCLPDHTGRPVYHNQQVALPIGLDLMHRRLQGHYYRQAAALLADAALLVHNAQTYAGERSPVVRAAQGAGRVRVGVLVRPVYLSTYVSLV